MFYACLILVSVVEEPYFIDLIKYIAPSFKLISADTVRNDIMKRYDIAVALVHEFLTKYEGRLSFTMDGWSSLSLSAYLALTVHFIDGNWDLQAFTLDFIPHFGDHSGSNMAKSVYASLKKFGVNDKVLTFTMDNASSNDTFMDNLETLMRDDGIIWNGGTFRVRCFAHVLNLAVQAAVGHPCLVEFIDRLTSLVRFIRASGQRTDKLKKFCEDHEPPIEYKKPMLPVATRWNSVLMMLVSILRVEKVCQFCCR